MKYVVTRGGGKDFAGAEKTAARALKDVERRRSIKPISALEERSVKKSKKI